MGHTTAAMTRLYSGGIPPPHSPVAHSEFSGEDSRDSFFESGRVFPSERRVVPIGHDESSMSNTIRHPDLTGLFRGVDEIRMSQKMVAAVANGW